MGSEVYITDILNGLYKLVKFLIGFIYRRIKDVFRLIYALTKLLFSIIIYIVIPNFPYVLVILIVFILVAFLWDYTIKPLIEIIILILNIVIQAYNGIVMAVSSLGVDLPTADELNASVPDFKTFCLGILIPVLFMPIKQALTGVIFA